MNKLKVFVISMFLLFSLTGCSFTMVTEVKNYDKTKLELDCANHKRRAEYNLNTSWFTKEALDQILKMDLQPGDKVKVTISYTDTIKNIEFVE
ncbi:MAG: hypothetical protein WDA59_00210 [Methanofastidiosum sp.]|jgi:hypothetical protein